MIGSRSIFGPNVTGVAAGQILGHFGVVGVGDLAEVLRGKLAEVGVVDAAGSGENHPVALVMGLDVLDQVIPEKTA
jgi:hypothetical protein